MGAAEPPGGAVERTVFTVGHSNHSTDDFLALLAGHRIGAVADVRSAPYSRFAPRFDREALAAALRGAGVAYAWLGCALGGRPDDPACYDNGRVDYARVAGTNGFRRGIERVLAMAEARRVALMCAEKDPLDCHRTLLAGRALDDRGVAVAHILADGGLEPHMRTMDRLIAKFDLRPDGDLFRPPRARGELVAEAIARQSAGAAFARAAPEARPEGRRCAY